jgi:hypothetical protein
VGYNPTPPALDVLALSPGDAFQIFVTKSPDFGYEDEYRILARDSHAGDTPRSGLPVTTNDFLQLPLRALTAIIAGCRADVDTIKALAARHAPALRVKRAAQVPDRYSLTIQE